MIEALCSEACAGRAPGTPGGLRARALVRDALRDAGLDPAEQPIGGSRGANLIATLPGDVDRWVLVAAHYDHLGKRGREYFPGADDNAAAVAILVEVARALAGQRAGGRGIVIAAFDAEESPYFMTGQMGSQYFADHPVVPIDAIDLMVCMDLVGHALGPAGLPEDVRGTMFALGAERSEGTGELVDELARGEPGVIVRRADAQIIPPLSDYDAFWRARVPFLFLTSGRSQRYHTTADTPEHLDQPKIRATTRWLERLVRRACARDGRRAFRERRDDASTLRSLLAVLAPLAGVSPMANEGQLAATALLAECDAEGALPSPLADRPARLVDMLESALA